MGCWGWFLIIMALSLFLSAPLPVQILIGAVVIAGVAAWLFGESAEAEAEAVRRSHLQNMHNLTGVQFEQLCAVIFQGLGYQTALTKQSNDGGIDLELHRDGRLVLVQCKRSAKPVGVKVVRELFGVSIHRGADKAIVCTNNVFTVEAERFAQGKRIELIDGGTLARLAADANVLGQ